MYQLFLFLVLMFANVWGGQDPKSTSPNAEPQLDQALNTFRECIARCRINHNCIETCKAGTIRTIQANSDAIAQPDGYRQRLREAHQAELLETFRACTMECRSGDCVQSCQAGTIKKMQSNSSASQKTSETPQPNFQALRQARKRRLELAPAPQKQISLLLLPVVFAYLARCKK